MGVIVSTMTDAFETGKAVVDDLNTAAIQTSEEHQGKAAILDILESKGKEQVVCVIKAV